jgi:alpha-glucosidase
MLTLYRRALAVRAAHSALGSGEATVSTRGDVLTVRCVGTDGTVRCVLNMGRSTALVRNPGPVLLASSTHVKASAGSIALPPDTAVWLAED